MFTHSGRIITLESGAPTIEDVGIHLSRIPRWAGGTLEEWSVAHHSLACLTLALNPPDTDTLGVRGCTTDGDLISGPDGHYGGAAADLVALWHDAHEFATEDVPPPFKSDGVRELQAMLDVRLYREVLDLSPPPEEIVAWVKWLDAVLTTAEAHVLMHPDVASHFPDPSKEAINAINAWRRMPADWVADFFADDTRKLLQEINVQS